MSTTTGPRSEITEHAPLRPGNGTSRSWQRTIAGRRYSFTAVTMPDGERRYFARQLEAGRDDLAARFACYWHPVLSWTVPAAAQGPQADVYLARSVKRGWHMEGVGVITTVTTHLNGQVTFSGPQGSWTFGLGWLVEATPAAPSHLHPDTTRHAGWYPCGSCPDELAPVAGSAAQLPYSAGL